VQALLTELLQTAIEDAVPAFQSARKASIVTALDQATAADWDAVETQLKVPLSGKRT
jgi:diacylglycerol kinase